MRGLSIYALARFSSHQALRSSAGRSLCIARQALHPFRAPRSPARIARPPALLCDDGLPLRACEDPIAAVRLGGEQRRVGACEQPLIVKLDPLWTGRDADGHRHG